MIRHFSKALIVFSFLFSSLLFSFESIPEPSGFINDFAGILSEHERAELENQCKNIEKSSGIEIGVVFLNSLEGRNIEEFSNEIFNKWGIGKKNKDNGILFLISLHDRKIRIEVGYGLEHVLTDGRCGSIIRNNIAPEFKNGRYFEGIKAGITEIDNIITGKKPQESYSTTQIGRDEKIFLFVWQLFCLVYASILAGIFGFSLIFFEIAVLDSLIKINTSSNFFYMLALLIPFFTCFFLFFLIAILNTFGVLTGKKVSRKSWISGFSPSSNYSSRGSSGGGFGGGASGGGGATGGW